MLLLILGPNLGIRVWKLKEEAVFSENGDWTGCVDRVWCKDFRFFKKRVRKCTYILLTCVHATLVAHGLELGSARVEARMGLAFPEDVDPG
jgi:hypothetical protein